MIIQNVNMSGLYLFKDMVSAPQHVTSNLILYYDPALSSSYPGTGTTVFDLSASGLNGAMTDVGHTVPYFSFNGTSSQISVADNATLEPGTGDWTMEAWVYLANGTGSKVILGKFDPGGGAQDSSYSIRTNGTSIYAQFGDGTGAYVNSNSYTMLLNTWVQITYVWKNISTNLLENYVNGTGGSVVHGLSSVLNTNTNLYIGSYNNGEFSQWMNGRIGIVRMYNRALTSTEVLQNYNANKTVYGLA